MIDRPLRVLHVIDTLEMGGAQRHLLSLTEALCARGHRCLIATSGEVRTAGSVEGRAVSLARDSIAHRLPLRFTARLIRYLAEERVDVVHAHLHAASVAAAAAASVHRLPLVITFHSDGAWQPAYYRMLSHWASGRADTAVVVARGLADDLRVRNIPSVLISNGVPSLHEGCADGSAIRAGLGIPPGEFVVGFTGRFVADKDPLLFVDAAARMAAVCGNAHFLMVGDGPLRGEIERRIARHSLSSRFTLTGLRPDASTFYPAADVIVVPSRRDACPLVPLEAMAAGRPVVGTAVGDISDQIVDGITGYVVPAGDSRALAVAALALRDAARREQFGRAGRARVAEQYSMRQMVDRTLAVYRAALRARERVFSEPMELRAAAPVAERAQ